jgi:THO complex subunit 3
MTLVSCRQHFESVKEHELRIPAHARVTSLAWSSDGHKLAFASTDGSVRVCDFGNTAKSVIEILKLVDVGKNFIVAFHPKEPNTLAVVNRKVFILNTFDGAKLFETDQELPSRPLNVAFNQSGDLLAVGTKSEEIFCYAFSDTTQLAHHWVYRCQFEANQFQFTTNDDLLLAGGPGTLRILSNSGSTVSFESRCANGPSQSLALSSQFIAVGSSDATIAMYRMDQLPELVTCISRQEWPVRHLSFSHDGQFLAAAGDDKFVDISLVPSGESVFRIAVPGPVNACKWHPSHLLLAYAPDTVDKNGRPECVIKIFGYQ